MLRINVPINPEGWDEEKQEFVPPKEQTLLLEHSLVSISKWESKWCKTFLGKGEKTNEETIDYIKCMTVTQNVNPEVYKHLTAQNVQEINEYIAAPMTATHIPKQKQSGGNRDALTSEVIYYQMIALNIPFECQKWHLNRLLMLISVCSIKNAPPKKMSRREIMSRNAALNAQRRAKMNTRG